jgi:hypothetical protein
LTENVFHQGVSRVHGHLLNEPFSGNFALQLRQEIVTKAEMASEATALGPILGIFPQIDASGSGIKPQMQVAVGCL